MKIKLELEIETVKDFNLETVNVIGMSIKEKLVQYEIVNIIPTLTILDGQKGEQIK